MSQTWNIDTIVPGSTSPATDISKITDGFDALRSRHSGSSDPTDTVAYMEAVNTTESTIKRRNSADSGWIITDTEDDDRVISKTSNYTVVIGDMNKLIACDGTSGAFTVTLPAASSAGDGFKVTINKTDSSANAITIDGNGSETVNGATTSSLETQYESANLVCDGSNWFITSVNLLEATQAEQETATADTVFVSPAVQQYHPSAVKGWVKYDQTTATVNGSYNVTSVTDTSTGRFNVIWDTDFSSANYACVGTTQLNHMQFASTSTFLATSTDILTRNDSFTVTDSTLTCLIASGDQ